MSIFLAARVLIERNVKVDTNQPL